MTTYYRFYDRDWSDGGIIALTKFVVVRETEKTAWISYGRGDEPRVVRKGARRSYAYPTIEQALASYRIRKHRQIQHLQRQLEHAQECYDRVKAEDFVYDKPLQLPTQFQRDLESLKHGPFAS